MKCIDSALGGRSCRNVRLAATNACAIIWPPNVRGGFLLGCPPVNVSSSTRWRSSTANNSLRSAFDALRASGSSPADTGALLVVVLADPVHVDQVGRAYCAGRGACDDDHQVTPLVAAELQQRHVDLTDHPVVGLDVRHDERLGTPGQRELAADLG